MVKFDGLLNLAIGKSRKDTKWKNTEMLWSDFLKRIETTTYTHETYAAYLAADKARQDEIKDVGGYVGGYVNHGRRKTDNILNRQLITLDIDFGDLTIWETYIMLYGNAAAIYSTHKHSPESQRLRLVIPLDRPVFTDEYQAIARRIAGDLGIDSFDDTTFEPSRLMYWPSTAKDGVYVYESTDDVWLSADSILEAYFDWTDASSWPESSRVRQRLERSAKKQGDPTAKTGLVGAFCRSYTIADAIDTFLSDVYLRCSDTDRYTYTAGSTTAGLVLYDEVFAYSHHGTDPISGKLCNAFDLVRIHKFGLQDEDAKEQTPNNKLPSYQAMLEFAAEDDKTKALLSKERFEGLREDFEGVDLEDEDALEWTALLDMDKKGNLKNTIENIKIILENDLNLKKRFRLNEFEKREMVVGGVPWDKDKAARCMTDLDDAELRGYMEKVYQLTTWSKIKDALDSVIKVNAYHPIKDYLNRLEWDGVERVDTLLIDYLGAEDSEYTRTVTRKSLVAAVARVYQPGIKYDYTLTLVGGQGIGKSTILRKLGCKWFSDSFATVQGKEAIEQVQGVWIIEISELAGLKKAEEEAIKQFISKQCDRYRAAYGKRVEDYPRQCAFFGTTNTFNFLKDKTGNRRFWPIACESQEPVKDIFKLSQDDIDQIWAEVYHLYKKKETLYLPPELEKIARLIQTYHKEINEKEGLIAEYLEKELPENWYSLSIYDRRNYIHNDPSLLDGANQTIKRSRVCASEIWCELFRGELKDLNRRESGAIYDALRSLENWEEYDINVNKGRLKFGIYGVQKAFLRNTQISPHAEDAQVTKEE